MLSTIATIAWPVLLYLAGHTKLFTRFLPVPAPVQDEEDLVKEFRAELSRRRKAAMGLPAAPPAPQSSEAR